MRRAFAWIIVTTVVLATLACSMGTLFELPTDQPLVITATSLPARTINTVAPVPLPNSTQSAPASMPVISIGQLDALLPDLYQKVNPGVVAILTMTDQGGGEGTGFVYDTKGNIITNYHVVEGATSLEVDFPSGFKTRGKVVGTDLSPTWL
jgi:S1-C subfamily serine protease